MVGRLVVVMVVVGTVVGSAACSGEGGQASPSPAGPVTTATVSGAVGTADASETPSPVTSAEATGIWSDFREPPPEAGERTPEGAVAFLVWWYAMLDWARTTGQSDYVDFYSTTDCDSCARSTERIRQAYDAGGRIEMEMPTAIRNASARPVDANGYTLVDFTLVSGGGRVIDSAGVTVEQFAVGEEPGVAAISGLQWTADAWLMSGTARP